MVQARGQLGAVSMPQESPRQEAAAGRVRPGVAIRFASRTKNELGPDLYPSGLSLFFSMMTALPLAVTPNTYGRYVVPPPLLAVSGSRVR